jgi:biopolymer transport protein ExbD
MSVRIKKGLSFAGLDMTPMIDVVFQLMIFFLVATRLEEDERRLDIVLPKASEAQPLIAKPKETIVNIDQEGRYFVGPRLVDAEELGRLLLQAAADNPAGQAVRIRADERCPVKFVTTAINLCERAGIRNHPLETAPSG